MLSTVIDRIPDSMIYNQVCDLIDHMEVHHEESIVFIQKRP